MLQWDRCIFVIDKQKQTLTIMTTLDLKIKTIQNLMEKAYNDEYVRLHNQLTELIRERKAQKQTQHGGNHEIRKRQDW